MNMVIEKVLLSDICRPKQWKTIPLNQLKNDGYPVYGANGLIGYYNKFNHEKPTLLITCRGATCGTVNISEAYSYVTGNAMALDNLDENRANIKFLYYYLKKRGFHDVISGSAQPQITRLGLNAITIQLPRLKEQKRIAAILDKADAIRRKREASIRLADEFLRSVFLDMFGDPVMNPKGWPVHKMENILTSIDSGWSPKCIDKIADINNWGVLKLSAVTKCNYNEMENKELPLDIDPKPSIEVKSGDLLFTRKNTYDLVAASAYVFKTRSKLMLSDTIFRLNLKEKSGVFPEFLWCLMTHKGTRKQLQKLASGSAGSMPNISKTRLMKFNIIAPPIDIQRKFNDILYRIKDIKNKLVVKNESSDFLMNSLTQRAFKGDL